MGSTTEHSSQCLSRRLDFDRGLVSTSTTTNTLGSTETAITRMDYQHEEIDSYTHSTDRPPRLLIEYHNNDCTIARTEDSQLTEEYSTSVKNTISISTHDPQFDYADSISNVCHYTSSPIHPTFITNEESDSTINSRLGHKTSSYNGMYIGAPLVGTQPSIMEWEEYPSPNTTTNNLRGCEQHGLGLQPLSTKSTTFTSLRPLESSRSPYVNQLERVEGRLSCITHIPSLTEHVHTNQDGQYHFNVLYQQTRRSEIIDIDDTRNNSMEMVPKERNQYSVNSRSRHIKSNSRFRVTTTIPKEQLDDTMINVSTYPTLLVPKRHRPFCRSEYDSAKKVRIVASRSWQLCDGCIHPVLAAIPLSISQPTMESHHQLPPKTITRTSTSSSHDYPLLENCHLVSGSTDSQYHSTNLTQPENIHNTSITNSNMANNSKQQLEACRHVEILNTQYQHTALNQEAQQLLTQHNLRDTNTNRSYQRGQLLFLKWASDNNISNNNFSTIDLINFLSTMKSTYDYAITTLQLFRSAVSQLHHNLISLCDDPLLNKFIITLAAQAPPIRLHRPTIDLQPTFNYLSNLNNASTIFASLQRKLAFLLGVACFFRPSDLQRIPLASVQVSSDLTFLSLEVHCPKEKRHGRRIIKSFQVRAHSKSTTLCPIQTFLAYRDRRPQCSSINLFVNSISPDQPLQASTIQGWISRLLRKSTSEPMVSLRSIASSLALASGVPKEDVVTMGNWSNSLTFENHYRREHLSLFDFTSILITLD
ncbi:hypothetical protein INT45_003555 [Circinella minor]|uniref:Core-binding (CB) domain-containing protein n=1 Tax=Circinella minor TaxID=1195481 RepID=A0A8H7VG79_9FUNG|nr:hypothetical protein INT45_003555 [Circinella minor]